MTTQSAESLPYASIVAAPTARVWVKEEESFGCRYPWAATHLKGQGLHGAISDADVDAELQSGRATVLRVGTGA